MIKNYKWELAIVKDQCHVKWGGRVLASGSYEEMNKIVAAHNAALDLMVDFMNTLDGLR